MLIIPDSVDAIEGEFMKRLETPQAGPKWAILSPDTKFGQSRMRCPKSIFPARFEGFSSCQQNPV